MQQGFADPQQTEQVWNDPSAQSLMPQNGSRPSVQMSPDSAPVLPPWQTPTVSMPPPSVPMMVAVGDSPDGLGDVPVPSQTLALTLLAVGLGAAIGVVYGGPMGGVAGGLYGGAIANGARAINRSMEGDQSDDKEAIISGTCAVVGAGIATYLVYKIANKEPPKERSGGLVGIK